MPVIGLALKQVSKRFGQPVPAIGLIDDDQRLPLQDRGDGSGGDRSVIGGTQPFRPPAAQPHPVRELDRQAGLADSARADDEPDRCVLAVSAPGQQFTKLSGPADEAGDHPVRIEQADEACTRLAHTEIFP